MTALKLWNFSSYDENRLSKIADEQKMQAKKASEEKAAQATKEINEMQGTSSLQDLADGYVLTLGGIQNSSTGKVLTDEEKANWEEEHSLNIGQENGIRKPMEFDWNYKDLKNEQGSWNEQRWMNREDDKYKIDGIEFTSDEVRQSVDVIHYAMNQLPPAGSILNYDDYAKMGTAYATVHNYSEQYLTKDQGEVLERSIMDRINYVVEAETNTMKKNGYYEDPNDLYSNKREDGNVMIFSATNQFLIRDIFNAYAGMNVGNEESVKNADHTFSNDMTKVLQANSGNKKPGSASFAINLYLEGIHKNVMNANAFLENFSKNRINVQI